jgi:hypothetical protein
MQRIMKAFTINSKEEQPHILDLFIVPGAFLVLTLKHNPTAHVRILNDPTEQSGLHLAKQGDTKVGMLAADMGLLPGEIPISHPDADAFIHHRWLEGGQDRDIIICDCTYVLGWETYREIRRLQLALGLEHVREGCTIIVQLHNVEQPKTISLLLYFRKFANITLFKHILVGRKRFFLLHARVKHPVCISGGCRGYTGVEAGVESGYSGH